MIKMLYDVLKFIFLITVKVRVRIITNV